MRISTDLLKLIFLRSVEIHVLSVESASYLLHLSYPILTLIYRPAEFKKSISATNFRSNIQSEIRNLKSEIVRLSGARWYKRRSAFPSKPACKSASSKAARGREVPVCRADPRPNREDAWRKNVLSCAAKYRG